MVPSFVPMAIFRPYVVVEHHYLRPWSPPKDEGALALLGGGIKTRTAVQATIKYWYETGCVYKFDRGARQTSGLSSNDHIENPISCPPRTAGSGKGCRPPLPTAGSLCPPPAAGRGSDRPAAGLPPAAGRRPVPVPEPVPVPLSPPPASPPPACLSCLPLPSPPVSLLSPLPPPPLLRLPPLSPCPSSPSCLPSAACLCLPSLSSRAPTPQDQATRRHDLASRLGVLGAAGED